MNNLHHKLKKLLRVVMDYPKSLFSKYRLQLDSYSCGPTVIYNALAWADKEKDFKKIFDDCKCTPARGTSIGNLNEAIRKKFDKVSFHEYNISNELDIKSLYIHLKKGGCIIIRYIFETDLIGHYALIIDDKFTVINPVDGRLKETWSMERLIDTLKFCPPETKLPCVWLIER